jgi:hypothetical protein
MWEWIVSNRRAACACKPRRVDRNRQTWGRWARS